jgi:hypothetical protein
MYTRCDAIWILSCGVDEMASSDFYNYLRLSETSAEIPVSQEPSAFRVYKSIGLVQQTTSPPLRTIKVEPRLTETSAVEARFATIDEIYPALRETNSALQAAVILLDQALVRLESAIFASKLEDSISADDEMQRLQVLLPELFCCRSIGDGFGSVINAIQLAFANKKGAPLELREIEAIARALRRLRETPFLKLDVAVQLVEGLEDANLIVEPPGLYHLAEL